MAFYEARGQGSDSHNHLPRRGYVDSYGPVMRDYLRHFRLAPIQCVVNVFRILGCVDALNEKMGLRLTHHNINWCHNLQHLKGKSYYMKAKDDKVRLIQCLPESSKWLNKERNRQNIASSETTIGCNSISMQVLNAISHYL